MQNHFNYITVMSIWSYKEAYICTCSIEHNKKNHVRIMLLSNSYCLLWSIQILSALIWNVKLFFLCYFYVFIKLFNCCFVTNFMRNSLIMRSLRQPSHFASMWIVLWFYIYKICADSIQALYQLFFYNLNFLHFIFCQCSCESSP